jgi:hypothetical protein
MNLKVKRVALIKAIEQTSKREQNRFASETAKKEASDVVNRKKYAVRLAAYLNEVSDGGKILGSYELERRLDKNIDWAAKPEKLKDFDCLLEKLNLATDEILNVDSKSEFFSFIKCKC